MDYVACPTCRGSGTHVNPAVDGNGLTAEDIDELGGDDFMEDYLGGVYDVICDECRGLRVVPKCEEHGCNRPVEKGMFVADEEGDIRPYSSCYEHLPESEREWADEELLYMAEMRAEQRMGA